LIDSSWCGVMAALALLLEARYVIRFRNVIFLIPTDTVTVD